jgi:hypothetical protein
VIREEFASDFLTADGCKGVKRKSAEELDGYMTERIEALRVELSRASTGVLTIQPREDDCGYCDLRPVCRVGTFGAGGALHGR